MHAAEAALQRPGQPLGERSDRQAGRIGGEHAAGREVRPDARVELPLPVHALGDGLDDQIAFTEPGEIVLVVRRRDQGGAIGRRERCRLELAEPVERPADDAVRIALARRQVEEHHRNGSIGEVRRNLGAHDAGAQDGCLSYRMPRERHGHGSENDGCAVRNLPAAPLQRSGRPGTRR